MQIKKKKNHQPHVSTTREVATKDKPDETAISNRNVPGHCSDRDDGGLGRMCGNGCSPPRSSVLR